MRLVGMARVTWAILSLKGMRGSLKMGSVLSEITCPKCGFRNATEDYYYRTSEVYVFCMRCGYSESVTRNWKKKRATYREEKSGGIGAFCYQLVGAVGFALGTIGNSDEFREKVERGKSRRKVAKECSVFSYTFRRSGEWYIRDVIEGETLRFSLDRFLGESRRLPEQSGSRPRGSRLFAGLCGPCRAI